MRAASHGETLIRSRNRNGGSAWSEHSIGLPATQWLEALRVSLKAVGTGFVAIGSRKNLIHGKLICRWSYSQSDALITSVAAPDIRLLNNSISSYKGKSSGAGAQPESAAADEQAVAFTLGGL